MRPQYQQATQNVFTSWQQPNSTRQMNQGYQNMQRSPIGQNAVVFPSTVIQPYKQNGFNFPQGGQQIGAASSYSPNRFVFNDRQRQKLQVVSSPRQTNVLRNNKRKTGIALCARSPAEGNGSGDNSPSKKQFGTDLVSTVSPTHYNFYSSASGNFQRGETQMQGRPEAPSIHTQGPPNMYSPEASRLQCSPSQHLQHQQPNYLQKAKSMQTIPIYTQPFITQNQPSFLQPVMRPRLTPPKVHNMNVTPPKLVLPNMTPPKPPTINLTPPKSRPIQNMIQQSPLLRLTPPKTNNLGWQRPQQKPIHSIGIGKMITPTIQSPQMHQQTHNKPQIQLRQMKIQPQQSQQQLNQNQIGQPQFGQTFPQKIQNNYQRGQLGRKQTQGKEEWKSERSTEKRPPTPMERPPTPIDRRENHFNNRQTNLGFKNELPRNASDKQLRQPTKSQSTEVMTESAASKALTTSPPKKGQFIEGSLSERARASKSIMVPDVITGFKGGRFGQKMEKQNEGKKGNFCVSRIY